MAVDLMDIIFKVYIVSTVVSFLFLYHLKMAIDSKGLRHRNIRKASRELMWYCLLPVFNTLYTLDKLLNLLKT